MAIDPVRVKSVFLAASVVADATARAEFLDRACGNDVALRQRVEALLHADDGGTQGGAFDPADVSEPGLPLTAVATAAGDDLVRSPEPAKTELPSEHLEQTQGGDSRFDATGRFVAGQVIAGRYTLLEVLGEGGMGIVYRASQSQPVKRQVALKLIKSGMDSRGLLARFDAERQALALMDHPNIARVYDGGATEYGRPYFVMELVDGVPITTYCDRRRLSVRTRLELFVSVCEAVQHAHQKGIIHRDLKPSNVMVTEVDGRAMPKVIDFGVAKATDFDLTDQTLPDTGAIVGTPTYMSPEQADPSSMDIDTRTDVYALGVILYELLAGSPPIDSKQFMRGALLEMLRMVREVEPPKPSTKVSTAEALPNIAASRDVDPEHLKRALRGDLDWIVMKAIEKDRGRRYATANGFAADIQRHLAHEPVTAAPPSRAYRVRKFVRKNRGVVIATSLIFFSLLMGMAGTILGLIEARRQTAAADRSAMEAKTQAKVASDNYIRANAEALAARLAERKAQELAESEAAAKALARRETLRVEVEKKRTEEQLTRAEWLLYAGKLAEAQNDFEAGNGGLALHYLKQCQATLRGWEHNYLWSRVNARQTLLRHPGSVWSVVYSRDGKYIVTGGEDHTVKIWDAQAGRELRTIVGHTDDVHGVAISPDGTRIVAGDISGEVKVWDFATGRQLLSVRGKAASVLSVAFSPDGKRIAAGLGAWGGDPDAPYEAKIWDAKTGAELLSLKGLTSRVLSVSFSPDGKRILTGFNHGPTKIWDSTTGQELLGLDGRSGAVWTAAYSADGKRIVTGSEDSTVSIWDAEKGTRLHHLKGHRSFVWGVAFSPDGKRVATGSYDQTVRVWDATTGLVQRVLKGHAAFVRGVAFSPDGRRLISGSDDGSARVWDFEKGQEIPILKGHGDFVRGLAFSPHGRRIVTGSGDNTAKLWDAATYQEIRTFKGHTEPTVSADYAPDGKRVASASKDGTARVWDVETGRELLVLKGHVGELWSVKFSPDGKYIGTGGLDATARLWDAATGRELHTLKGAAEVILGVAFSPDSKILAAASSDGRLRVWDVATGREIRVLDVKPQGLNSVAFSPDGSRIVAGVSDKSLWVWETATGREVMRLQGHTAPASCVVYSPDGRRIATGSYDLTVKIWESETGRELLSLGGHTADVLNVAFSPDGRRLAAGFAGIFGIAKIWSAERNQEVLLLKGHSDNVTSVSFSPDGGSIYGWDAQKNVLAWSVADGRPIPPVSPPEMPPPGPARSPDRFHRAQPEGKFIVLTDDRPPPKDNAWPLEVPAAK